MEIVLYGIAALSMACLGAILLESVIPPQGWGWRLAGGLLSLSCFATSLYAIAKLSGVA